MEALSLLWLTWFIWLMFLLCLGSQTTWGVRSWFCYWWSSVGISWYGIAFFLLVNVNKFHPGSFFFFYLSHSLNVYKSSNFSVLLGNTLSSTSKPRVQANNFFLRFDLWWTCTLPIRVTILLVASCYTSYLGCFPFHLKFWNVQTWVDGMEISREHFQKICKWWNFQNVNHSTEIQEILGGEWNEIEIPGKKCLKIWEYLL